MISMPRGSVKDPAGFYYPERPFRYNALQSTYVHALNGIRMTRIVAFFNQKGGTAKTTSTLNTAAALSERGYSVLAVDLDPQASLTMALGVNVAEISHSVYDLLIDDDTSIAEIILPTTISHVLLAPSHPDLAAAELELLNVLERERQLQRKLPGDIGGAVDFVLIDSPPALNIISINILVAADELIIPIEPHPLSLMVLSRLFETVAKVRRLNPGLRVTGFLPTKVHHSSRLVSDMMDQLRLSFPDIPLLPSVPLSIKGAEAVAEHTSILEYSPRSPIANAYRDVAEMLLRESRRPTMARIANG
jgi:chromosome partitioning protein